MDSRGSEGLSWIDSLNQRFNSLRYEDVVQELNHITEAKGRTALVVKARWVLLMLIGIYILYAGSSFYFSRYGFFLSPIQIYFILFSVIAVCSYNAVYQLYYDKIDCIKYVDHLQIILDFLFVTILIHFSGGGSSWFWPVYLIVTIEAAVLLDRKADVWILGAVGGLFYGALLGAEYFDIISYVKMPFVASQLYGDALYLTLMWLWVCFLNAAVAVIGAFLMSVIRRETAALRESEERLVDFLDSASDLIFSFTPEGKFLYVNKAWAQTLGYDLGDLSSLTFKDIVHSENQAKCLAELSKAIKGEKSDVLESCLVAGDGRFVDVEGNLTCSLKDGEVVAVWGICRDVTARKQAQEQLYHMAHHDMLTDLPNRLFFIDRLNQAKVLAKRLKQSVAVLFLDLDRFKIINDTLGHAVGDKLLQEVAKRLTGCVREVDTVARFGGDEFTILLQNIKDATDVDRVAKKILKTLAKPVVIDDHELFITTSIGVSMFPKDEDDPVSLVKKADIAMYNAKAHGKNHCQFYDASMDFDTEKRLVLENGMRRALEREEFELHYQPKVDVITGNITAFEALLRWQHPELGLLPPSDFISLAEETGQIVPIGEWVIRRACEQNKAWQEQGLPKVRIAVNLSGYQLQQKDLIDRVKSILEETGLDASSLEFEITETVIMQNPDFAIRVLSELKDLGIHISIDDFGTGYSSLSHLKRFSVNTLKMDKSFLSGVEENLTDAAIATAIISMGNCLDLKVIAEGVETEGQLSFLKEKMCDEVQGYLFSRPVPARDVEEILRSGLADMAAKVNPPRE